MKITMNKHNLGEYVFFNKASKKQIQDDQLDLQLFLRPSALWSDCDHIYAGRLSGKFREERDGGWSVSDSVHG